MIAFYAMNVSPIVSEKPALSHCLEIIRPRIIYQQVDFGDDR